MRKRRRIFLSSYGKQNSGPQTLSVLVAADDNWLPQMFSTYDSLALQVNFSPQRFGYTSVLSLQLPVVASQCAARQNKASS